MTVNIHARNVPEAYHEAIWNMHIRGEVEESRNGRVIAIPYPVYLEIKYPWERVLFEASRDANPFFHVMEFVWMMSGSNDARWISRFNKRMMEYSDEGVLRGAYGWRWQNPTDQLNGVIELLQREGDTRQAVLSMWDPMYDGPKARTSDRPCNTHIYFRVSPDGLLDMTVCNRSNDLIWGMLGANAVHMTMLHELIALASGHRQGSYRVFTNNLHVYPDMPRFEEIYKRQFGADNRYIYQDLPHTPLLQPDERWEDFRVDCERLVDGDFENGFQTHWMNEVAATMYEAYTSEYRNMEVKNIDAPDWQLACQEWCARRV